MKILKRIFIDGLSGMAIGLFATLIIGTILEQAGTIIGGDIGNMIVMVASIAKVLTGAGIGIGVASKLGESTLVCASAASAGMIGAFASGLLKEISKSRTKSERLRKPPDVRTKKDAKTSDNSKKFFLFRV